ncbi:DsbA family protein [Palleronia sediminis]|uniref:DsbA family protein n=1 Tax=Palleronia sediminis TaxID=2547833 RepID=A0A4R6AIY6_9RHOB|nr:DsbA family protein [Palleronia sediminis]TDL84171.1 DsbA family protein [Palleronia sediminis]
MLRPLALSLALAAGPAAAFDIDAMTEAERESFGAEVRDYLLENPQVLIEALGVLEQREQQAQAAAGADMIASNSAAIFEDGVSYVGGNPEGDLTVVEFLDYRCGYCKRAFGEVEELLASDGNIRFIIKEFPILGEQSMLASRFAIAVRRAAGDEAYKAVHDEMMLTSSDITPDYLADLGEDQGLDWDEIQSGMEAPQVTEEIAANRALGQTLEINGTPSFIFGNEMVRGYVPLDVMRDIAEGQREEG